MMQLHVPCYEPIGDQQPGCVLTIGPDPIVLPRCEVAWERVWRDHLDREAEVVMQALRHLPQGVKTAVLVRLLDEERNLWKVEGSHKRLIGDQP